LLLYNQGMTVKETKAELSNTKHPLTRSSDEHAEYRIRDRNKVRAVLAALDEDIYLRPWKGKAGLTDRSAYIALLRVAWYHGELIPTSGVRVSISMREWAEKTGVRLPTINKAQKRLMFEYELIRRDGRGKGPQSGAFVLLCPPERNETLTQQVSINKGSVKGSSIECFISRASLRWGSGMMGKTKEALLDAVRCLGGSATAEEIAELLDRKGSVHHLRKHLRELVSMGILERRGDKYSFQKYRAFALEWERAINGEYDADERVHADHADQRKKFREAWENGEVRSRSKKAPKPKQGSSTTRVGCLAKDRRGACRRTTLADGSWQPGYREGSLLRHGPRAVRSQR
jgi:hypothetical protein